MTIRDRLGATQNNSHLEKVELANQGKDWFVQEKVGK